MSGIVGIVNLDGAPVDRELVGRLTESIAYRGPDVQDTWTEGSVGFGHTMLRTTFEAENERQPFTIDGRVWITADARIDGRSDLIAKLKAKGHEKLAATAPDVELILRAYLTWDSGCVDHLIGDFAYAIWDGRNRRVSCARDHFGVKPFYYARIGSSFVFGNTLECLRRHPGVTARLNEVAIGDFLLFGVNQDPATTTFADIERLPGGHTLTGEEGRILVRRYWSLPVDGHVRYKDPAEYVEHFRFHLQTAVSDRLRTNRVACEMSGGLDSTSIAATAKRVLEEQGGPYDIRAHAIVYDRLIPDRERHFSGIAAKGLDIPIEYLAADDYPNFEPRHCDCVRSPEPFYVYPRAAVSTRFRHQMATHGRVALTGWDGDALMCDSPRLYFRELMRRGDFRELAAGVDWYVSVKRMLPPVGVRTWLKRLLGTYPGKSSYPVWIDSAFASRVNLRARWEQGNAEVPALHPTRPVASKMFSAPIWWHLFESYDPGVTQVAQEVRHPLIDLRLVRYILSIPPVPWCDEKHILREAMANVLPAEVLRRPKTALAGDPAVERVRSGDLQGLEAPSPIPEFARYIDEGALARAAVALEPHALWQRLIPECLDRWLEQQRYREILRPGHRVESETSLVGA